MIEFHHDGRRENPLLASTAEELRRAWGHFYHAISLHNRLNAEGKAVPPEFTMVCDVIAQIMSAELHALDVCRNGLPRPELSLTERLFMTKTKKQEKLQEFAQMNRMVLLKHPTLKIYGREAWCLAAKTTQKAVTEYMTLDLLFEKCVGYDKRA
jgi:hypothetical protein